MSITLIIFWKWARETFSNY